MTKIDVFSGFLGAGKTTLIKKLIKEAYENEKVVLIENEFGEIGIDGGFLKDAGVEITEMNSGCICCSLVGDFGEALKKVISDYSPDRIIIEPSGVGKLSDVIRAIKNLNNEKIELNSFTTVADAKKCKMYIKNFGEFYNDQIEHAGCIALSHISGLSDEKINECVNIIRNINKDATIITTDWEKLTGPELLKAMEGKNSLSFVMELLEKEHHDEHEHHHHHEDEHEHHHHDDEHEHHHHHDDEHEHHHHHDDEHEHHHHHDEDCDCGCHHDHEGHHHADEVFVSWGKETVKKFTKDEINAILSSFEDIEKFGIVLRAKGIVESTDGKWIHFDYVPGESDIRYGSADITGRLCVIGSKLNEEKIEELFALN